MNDDRLLLGMLTPSSNTVLEPVTTAMLAGVPRASVHFSRFRVTEISLADRALAQFDEGGIVAAARLLADARCRVIGWNGTSASWLGFERDQRLCDTLAAETGAAACTSVLALNERLQATGVTRLGLVTPYRGDVQQAIAANYARIGIRCVGEAHLDLEENFAFSRVDAAMLRTMAHEVAQSRPQAIAILCTNLRGAPLAAELEQALGLPVYDSIATVVWKSLRLAGADTTLLRGWGSLFEDNRES